MRNSKAKLLKRIQLTEFVCSPDRDLSYKDMKRKYSKGVPLRFIIFTPRCELVRQGNW